MKPIASREPIGGVLTTFILAAVYMLLGGCASEKHLSRGKALIAHGPSQEDAFERARIWLGERGWFQTNYFDVVAKRNDARRGWAFWFLEIPMKPGLEFTIFVFDDGPIEFIPGW
jgi:hypothetical protein